MRKHRDGLLHVWEFRNVMDLYQRHITPRLYQKKHLGQVFTPFVLIDKIIDQIPSRVMSSPSSTFLDPSAGMGGFLVMLYYRLMMSLEKAIPNDKKRHDHIITNMLYAAELTKNNVARMRRIFGDGLHIYEGDSLAVGEDGHYLMTNTLGVRHFKVIVGNPPFEKQQKNKDVDKQGGHNLWTEFIRSSFLDWLEPNGLFGMVIPPGWRKPSDDRSRSTGVWDLMTKETTPLLVEMYDMEKSSELFGGNVVIRVDLVVSRNRFNQGFKTMIRDADGKTSSYDLRKWPFLPNANLRTWNRVLTLKTTYLVLNSSFYHSTRNDRVSRTRHGLFQHKVIHAIHSDGREVFLYANKKDKKGGFGVPKVIFNGLGGWNQPILDATGKYGMSEVVFGIPISSEKQGHAMINFFSKDVLHRFEKDMAWATSRPKIYWNMFNNMKTSFYNMSID